MDDPLRIYFIPSMDTGHLVPLVELARIVAARGEHVTIITTHSKAKSLEEVINKDQAEGHTIQIHSVQFPSKELGLPDGLETPLSAHDFHTLVKIHRGIMLLRQPMEHFMRRNPPHSIISDSFYPWTSKFSNELGIPRLVFDGSGIFAVCLNEAIRIKGIPLLQEQEQPSFVIDGPSHRITIKFSQLPESVRSPNSQANSFTEMCREAELNSYGRVVNSFSDLDSLHYTQLYRRLTGIKVWQIGPTKPLVINEKLLDTVDDGEEVLYWMSWLNSKEPNSVLYTCFGSGGVLSDSQMQELALGLESSGHHFIWVVNTQPKQQKETLAKKKGLIVRGWVPQVMILEHPATGGFMTHCGWNSVLEAVTAGVPMITWPLTAEQFYNEKLITQVHGIGVEVGAEEWTRRSDDAAKKLVGRDHIKESVRRLMDGESLETVEIRRRVQELAEKCKVAVQVGGSSHNNVSSLIEDLKRFTIPHHSNATA